MLFGGLYPETLFLCGFTGPGRQARKGVAGLLIRFLAKRLAVLGAAVMVFAWVLDGFAPALPLGIALGGFLSVYKSRLTGLALLEVANAGGMKRAVLPGLMQLATCGLLVLCALFNLKLFAGFAAGLLLLPLFICVNAATEKLGLTHNQWGEAPQEGGL